MLRPSVKSSPVFSIAEFRFFSFRQGDKNIENCPRNSPGDFFFLMSVFVWQLSGVFTVMLRSDSLKAWIGVLLAACLGGFHTVLNLTLAGALWVGALLQTLFDAGGLQTSPLSAWIPVPYCGDDTQGGNRCDLRSSLWPTVFRAKAKRGSNRIHSPSVRRGDTHPSLHLWS